MIESSLQPREGLIKKWLNVHSLGRPRADHERIEPFRPELGHETFSLETRKLPSFGCSRYVSAAYETTRRIHSKRPDGTRVPFMPYPTPILKNGALVGAVNILIDITDANQAAELWDQADRARRLARGGYDKTTVETLGRLADEYEARATALGGPRKVKTAIH